jgi:outer membrane protein
MLMDIILRYSLTLIALVLGGRLVHANDLKQLYELALTRDTTLQVAHFQRDAAIEVRPQALASLLPQLSASASATRERAGYDSSQMPSTQSAGCNYIAIRAYNQARYDYLTSVLMLKLEAGRLTERDLSAIDDLLVEGS